MQPPLFTVIITTHNRKDILPRAIQSVLNQTFGAFELLVIDNGSTDGTESIVSGIKDPRIIYVRNPSPTDSCDAPRNLGIKMAEGRFISFLDDDDMWYSKRLEKVKGAFEKNPDIPAVCHNEYRIANGKIIEELKYGPWTEDIYEKLLYERNCFSPCATTIKIEALRKLNGFDLRKAFSGAADYDLWIRMAKAGMKAHFIQEALGEFTMTGHNYSIKDAGYGVKVASIVEMHIRTHEKKRLFSISKKGMWRLFRLYTTAAKYYVRSLNYNKALKYYGKAIFFVFRRPSLIFNILSGVRGGTQ